MKVSLALETGDAREVHHFALLIGYGCSVINPYLAFETLDGMIRDEMLPGVEHKLACKNFAKAAVKGVVKVMSKMGISAVQSYHGAQVFEAVGLRQDVIDEYFSGTASRVGGVGLDVIAREVLMRHTAAFAERKPQSQTELPSGGQYQWRADGEFHLFNPESIHRLQKSVRTGSYATYKSYAELIDDRAKNLSTLRGLLDFKQGESIPIDEVESVESLMKRFKTGAMSYGSISKEAHETLAIAMNRVGGKSNTGEGGEDPDRYVPMENGDSKNSAIKQVASGRFGVTSHYLVNAKELQIKMAQGAKPGEGGQLPGTKVYPWIAKTRAHHRRRGPHLAAAASRHLFHRRSRRAHPRSQEREPRRAHQREAGGRSGRGHHCRGRRQGACGRGADLRRRRRHRRIAADLADRTPACRGSSGLAETHQTLVINNLRSRIVVETDGQLKTGRDVAIAALLGAEEFGFATAPLVAVGCIMMRVCHLEHLPGGCGDAGSAAAREVRRQARACRELHALHRAAPARNHGAARLPQARRHGGPRRHARAARRHRSLEGQGLRLQQHPVRAGRRPRDRPLQADRPGSRHRQVARRHHVVRPVRAGDRARREGHGRTAGAQRQPRGGHHHRQRGHEEVGRRGPARGHHPDQVQGFGGPELRRVHAEWHDLRARRRRQRLLRQGTVGRQARGVPVGRRPRSRPSRT